MIIRDARRLSTRGGAYLFYAYCMSDMNKQYYRLNYSHRVQEVEYGRHAKYSLASHDTSSICASDVPIDLEVEQKYNYLQKLVFVPFVSVYELYQPFVLSQFGDTASVLMPSLPCALDTDFCYADLCALYFHDSIAFGTPPQLHFAPIVYAFLQASLCWLLYRSFSLHVYDLHYSLEISFCSSILVLCESLYMLCGERCPHLYAFHNTVFSVQLSAHDVLVDTPCSFQVYALCLPDNDFSCIPSCIACIQTPNRLSCFCFLGKILLWQGRNLGIWNIFLRWDCLLGGKVVGYSRCISLSDVLTSPGALYRCCKRRYCIGWGQTIFNSSNYSINQLVKQLYGLFGMLKNMQKGIRRSVITPPQARKTCAALDRNIYMKNSCKSGKAVMPIPREGFNTPVESRGTWAPHAGDDVLRTLPKQKVKSLAEMSRPVLQKMSNKIVTTNAAPGIDAGFLNNVESCLKNSGMIYFLATPYHLYTNPTLNAGTTRTDTVTGVGSIPSSGVLGILLGVGLFSNTSGGGYVQIYPTGATAGQYANFSGPVAGQYTVGFAIVPVSAGGQITVKANAQNCVLQDWYIFGYIM